MIANLQSNHDQDEKIILVGFENLEKAGKPRWILSQRKGIVIELTSQRAANAQHGILIAASVARKRAKSCCKGNCRNFARTLHDIPGCTISATARE